MAVIPKQQSKKEIVVDGTKYIVQFYSPTYGFMLWSKLVRLLGEPIVKLVGMFRGDALKGKKLSEIIETLNLEDLDTSAATDSLAALFSNLKDEELPVLLKEILSATFFTGDGKFGDSVADHFDSDEFAGHYLHLLKLAGKTLGVQYPDFLSGIVKRRNAAAGASASSPASTKQ